MWLEPKQRSEHPEVGLIQRTYFSEADIQQNPYQIGAKFCFSWLC